MKPFPWAAAMGFGFGVLRLAPDVFWRMTPRELAQAIRAIRGPATAPLVRAELDDLLARFPDAPGKGGRDD
ncbi:hypothetical protein NB311A_12514 [Nitrobacter sp. Nb-311A]|uniref:rcc01693 family protein n=1 Tax=unclassified Nitrobacter TaxID=2620411 RepID=UPI0000684CAD|nr:MULTISPECIES: rcc01693 family protein [unclassified Nitrobacter]EAQ35645.1 hypothetical protein NB311A_12514 [Nitrobacter sp. Nb-311A]MCB1392000.1 phage tail assembly chaperone [Nitrobacter sp.]MCV0385676.1 phage tail assembly chaperone [Nitrobacter sp.]